MKSSDKAISVRMWSGFSVMVASIGLAVVSFVIDKMCGGEFSWFAASGAVMVSGSILFERLSPGTGLNGSLDLDKIPDSFGHKSMWMWHHSGILSIFVLIVGTLIWAYGALATKLLS